MTVSVDLKVAELLCSRLCHDLISPVNAVNTGMELLGDGGGFQADALSLVAASGNSAARKLAFFRAAFGYGGAVGAAISCDVLKTVAEDFFIEGRIHFSWSAVEPSPKEFPALGGRLLLNLILLAADSLPRGGSVEAGFAVLDEGIGLAVAAEGQGAGLRDEIRATLRPGFSPETLTARTVQAYFSLKQAERLGTTLEIAENEGGRLELAALLPR